MTLGKLENGTRRRGHADAQSSLLVPENVGHSNLKEVPPPVGNGQSPRRLRRSKNRKVIHATRVVQCLLLLSFCVAWFYYVNVLSYSIQSPSWTPTPTPTPTYQHTLGIAHPQQPEPALIISTTTTTRRKNETRNEEPSTATSSTGFKIPHILLFTHYRDLLHATDLLVDEEEKVLAANIRHSIDLHGSDTAVRFLTDEDCIRSLQTVFPALIPHFVKETQGMIKADICRGSALYESGGMYLDVDVGVRTNLWLDLLPTTEFVTSLVHQQSKYPRHFFQAILGAAPKSPIIYKYLQLFLDHYTGKETVKGPLGVILLRRAWDDVYNENTHSPSTELYQEVLYNKKFFPDLDPAPTWGVRRACHFVVVARAHQARNAEFTGNDGERKYYIPLYSRIAGSRMCPIQQQQQQQQNVTSN
jgi:hypothetical protein